MMRRREKKVVKALVDRIESVALNIVRVTLENGDQCIIQELDGELRMVEANTRRLLEVSMEVR